MFRNLITNQHVSGFDYESTFTFKTVFYRSSFSYCMCKCGFEHEYLDYIQESGHIKESMLENIIECISNGQCPHVTGVPPKYVKETKIYALHIAAVVDPTKALANAFKLGWSDSNLFNTTPFDLTIIKSNSETFSRINFRESDFVRPYAVVIPRTAKTKDKEYVQFDRVPCHKISLEKHYKQYMEYSIDKVTLTSKIIGSLQLAFHHNRTDIIEMIANNRKWFPSEKNNELIIGCCELAIIYDQPNYLKEFVEHVFVINAPWSKSTRLCNLCAALKRYECETVLSENGCLIAHQSPINRSTNQELLINILIEADDESLEDLFSVIAPYLESAPNVTEMVYSTESYSKKMRLNTFNCRFFSAVKNVESLKHWLSLGVDINAVDADGMTPLLHHLSQRACTDVFRFRQCLEIYIYENPDIKLSDSAVAYGFEIDKAFYSRKPYNFDLIGNYLLDGKKHALCGHDENLILNMTGPILIECGFSVPNCVHEMVESRKKCLPQEVYVYLQNFLHYPRSLQVICRDALRMHFKGRHIHSFAGSADIPQAIKDIILLKPLLRCVPKELFF